jgi:hypothetical protein
MREIARFLGIFVFFCDEKDLEPHIHARYNQYNGVIDVETMSLRSGNIPPRVQAIIVEWIAINAAQIRSNWDLLQKGEEVLPAIAPLV